MARAETGSCEGEEGGDRQSEGGEKPGCGRTTPFGGERGGGHGEATGLGGQRLRGVLGGSHLFSLVGVVVEEVTEATSPSPPRAKVRGEGAMKICPA